MIPVLHLRQGTSLYGADRAVLALSAATPSPYAPIVGAIGSDALVTEAQRLGIPALRFESRSRFDLACARAVAACARERNVQLLHAHDFKALFVALAAGLLARIPVVATFHGDTKSTWMVRGYELFARFLGNFTRGVAVVSRALETTLRRWVRTAPVQFVPNGLPLSEPVSLAEQAAARAALGVPEQSYCVAVIGRLSVEKGHRVLLDAARRAGRPMVLLFAGDGPLRAELEGAAADLDVRFLGYRDPVRQVFAAADVIALPSLTEGLPLTALEALALGRPLIASAVGELPDLLAGDAGVLVPAGDAAALAEALAKLENPEIRAAVKARALVRARDYDVAAMGTAYAALYGRALSARPRSSR